MRCELGGSEVAHGGTWGERAGLFELLDLVLANEIASLF